MALNYGPDMQFKTDDKEVRDLLEALKRQVLRLQDEVRRLSEINSELKQENSRLQQGSQVSGFSDNERKALKMQINRLVEVIDEHLEENEVD